MRTLDPTQHSTTTNELMNVFSRRIVGQDAAKQALLNIVERYQAGLSAPNMPAGNALFLGPTGTGKTATIEVMCEALFGNPRACIKVDCAEFQHSHEIAKLIGSPPGYLGHRETHPMLTQEVLDKYHTEKLKLSILLFDEIEKASDSLWSLLLGILDKATLTLGDNTTTDFRKTVIVMTSNIGSQKISELVNGGMGFQSQDILSSIVDSQIDSTAKEAAKRKFSPEFYNRLEEIVVFHTLTEEQINSILLIELGMLQTRLLTCKVPFFFHIKNPARELLIKEGYSKVYGARHLRRAINRKVLSPLANLLASGQIREKDVVIIDEVGEPEFRFSVTDREFIRL